MNMAEWLQKHSWQYNPFTFSLRPDLLVGYREQKDNILSAISSRHKLILIIGPTGSGKTTFLKWLELNNKDFDILYLSKPPKNQEEFVDIFNIKYKPLFFWKKINSIYQVVDLINSKTHDKPLLMLCDEIHETSKSVLEWLRVINDQCNVIMIFSALPLVETKLMQKLESLRKRVACRIELFSLTKEETEELIKKRIESIGGHGTEPFTKETIDAVYEQSAGFPREVLRTCDAMINKAASQNSDILTAEIIEKKDEPIKIDLSAFSDKQRQILEQLIQPLTPLDLVNTIGIENYTSANHAIRSTNNILKRLLKDGYIERTKKNRAYIYSLSPKLKTIFVTK